jgi:hypothetical protein
LTAGRGRERKKEEARGVVKQDLTTEEDTRGRKIGVA